MFDKVAGFLQPVVDAIKIPPPAKEPLTDPQEIDKQYRYWRLRILYSIVIGYTVFYFVRKNISLTIPYMESELGISKTQIGLVMSLGGLMYGVSKFFNGIIGDQVNPRYFMAFGLFCSAAMNIGYGMSSSISMLILFWTLNGWFQGIGVAPCGRSLAHWYTPKERGVKTSIWNSSTSIGAGLIGVLCGTLVGINWRLCLFVPAAMAIVGAVFIWQRLRDTPQSLGLPSIEEFGREECVATPAAETSEVAEESEVSFRRFLMHNVFLNPMMWAVSLANFFLYVVRYAILDWSPTYLQEMRDIPIAKGGYWVAVAFEGAGILGMLIGGWISDRVFRGRAGRACFFSMGICALFILLFWQLPSPYAQSIWLNSLLAGGIGFFCYSAQMLVVVIAINLGTKRAAATAIGLTGLFGYLSTVFSGVGLGWLAQHYGWDKVFPPLVACATVSAILFAFLWNTTDERRSGKA